MLGAVAVHDRAFIQGDSQTAFKNVGRCAPHDIGIEIGPEAHGTLSPWAFELGEKLVMAALDFLEHANRCARAGELVADEATLPVFRLAAVVRFPTDDTGEIAAMIHPDVPLITA